MDKLFSLLKLHALSIMAFVVAFLFWKDYLTKPHQKVAKEKLAHITGTLSQAGNTISLPSGYSSSHYIIIKEANFSFATNFTNDASHLTRIIRTNSFYYLQSCLCGRS